MLRARTPATTLGTKATFPGFIEPALATIIERPPSGDRWFMR
jgi:bifunctional non-homologous end joining protein LigD